jgi:thiol-disulfide isomerase/thioredoxin
VRAFAVVALVVALSSCSGRSSDADARRLPDVRLAQASGALAPTLASCPTDKCLTVLVAPWCGVCRAEAPNIVQFRKWLAARGVTLRVVVGLSPDAKAVRAFGAQFGPDALLDFDSVLPARATPTFLVSDRAGRVLKVLEGFPSASRGPVDLARTLGLI